MQNVILYTLVKQADIYPLKCAIIYLVIRTPIYTNISQTSIKRSKVTGIDDLPPGLIKDAADVLSVPLSHIINMSLDIGQFPQEWKAAKIIPLHKSGSTKSFDNYRPISVLPIVSNVIEKIVHKQLMNFLDENKLLSTSSLASDQKCQQN